MRGLLDAIVGFTGPYLEELEEVQHGHHYPSTVEGADWYSKNIWVVQYKLVLMKLLASFGILRLVTLMDTTDKRCNKKDQVSAG